MNPDVVNEIVLNPDQIREAIKDYLTKKQIRFDEIDLFWMLPDTIKKGDTDCDINVVLFHKSDPLYSHI